MTIKKTGTVPTTQKDLTLSLILLSNNNLNPTEFYTEFYFDPRPEELTYTHPTRASVIQTLGGAWVDDFGEGIVDITLSGHTGWRANEVPLKDGVKQPDGMDKAMTLRTLFSETFHQLRLAAANSGIDPDDAVKLYFVDILNKTNWQIYPVSFQLRRNKSRPLLYQYQLRMLGLDNLLKDTSFSINTSLNAPGRGS